MDSTMFETILFIITYMIIFHSPTCVTSVLVYHYSTAAIFTEAFLIRP